jgi:hypothetical protein
MDNLNPDLSHLRALVKQLADVGVMTKFAKKADNLFVMTVTVKHKIWETECKTLAEAAHKLNQYCERNFARHN